MSITLRDINPGESCRVIRANFKGELHKRIMEMGITPGSVIEVERFAPLGDPMELKIKGYHLSLRKSEAACIEVERV